MQDLPELKGKVLGCFCPPRQCHGEVLIDFVEKLGTENMSHYKLFDPELYDNFDVAGRTMTKNLMDYIGFTIIDPGEIEKYTYDMAVEHEGKQYKIEFEVKQREHFDKVFNLQYNTFDVPVRKQHNTSDIFIMFNEDGTNFLVCPMMRIHKAPRKEKMADQRHGGGTGGIKIVEEFYAVFNQLADFYSVDNEGVELVRLSILRHPLLDLITERV
jgi:hypothetical protein